MSIDQGNNWNHKGKYNHNTWVSNTEPYYGKCITGLEVECRSIKLATGFTGQRNVVFKITAKGGATLNKTFALAI